MTVFVLIVMTRVVRVTQRISVGDTSRSDVRDLLIQWNSMARFTLQKEIVSELVMIYTELD